MYIKNLLFYIFMTLYVFKGLLKKNNYLFI